MTLTISQNVETGPELGRTPPTNRGVQLTGGVVAAISIDWISVTLPNTPAVWRQLKNTFGEWQGIDTRIYGYSKSAFVLGTGRAFWSDDKPENGIHLRLPATALAEWAHGYWLLLSILAGNGGKFTRLDLAFDDFAGLLDIPTIAHNWHTGQVNTRYRSMTVWSEPVEQGSGPGQISGLSFGNRQSQSYIRIYDKRLERQKNGVLDLPDHWVRLEIETKDEKATAIVSDLLKLSGDSRRAEYLAGLLAGLFDVVVNPATDTNKARWKRADWWDQFLAGASKVRLGLAKVQKTLEQVKTWFVSSIAPMAAVLLLATHEQGMSGYDWIIEAIVAGEDRFKHKHRVLAGISS